MKMYYERKNPSLEGIFRILGVVYPDYEKLEGVGPILTVNSDSAHQKSS